MHLRGVNFHTALFHPNWSGDTAGLKGTRILNNGRHFWEMYISNRIFGTSIMFGIGTKMARVHADTFINLVGEDRHSWGLSHKGLLWHNGKYFEYTKPFSENRETKIGVFFDGIAGTLTYYKDGECLGVAFRGLQDIKEPLFPIISSSAAKTEITLRIMKRDFVNLQDRCRSVIVEHFKNKNDLDKLMLPSRITSYLEEGITANIPNNYKPWRRYMSINKNKIFLFG